MALTIRKRASDEQSADEDGVDPAVLDDNHAMLSVIVPSDEGSVTAVVGDDDARQALIDFIQDEPG